MQNFLNCFGPLDDKHVVIKPSAKSGFFFSFNYKNAFTIVLLTLVDVN
jgi:hypothetical protein